MQCPKCSYEPTMVEMQGSPDDCVKCGVNYLGHARHIEQKRLQDKEARATVKLSPVVRDAIADYNGAQPVVVVDVRMSFFSMVVFMVKWVLASIPAAIILAIIIGFVYALISAVPQYMYYKEKAEASSTKNGEYKSSEGIEPRIKTAASDKTIYFDAGLIAGASASVLTVRALGQNGEVKYSRLGVDCGTALAVVTDQADSLNEVMMMPMPKDYEIVIANTTRWHIAKYACAKSSRLSPLLK